VVEEICDLTDMLASECGCRNHRGAATQSSAEQVHPPREYHGERPPKDAILVSRTGIAHHYGCTHLPHYDYLVPPDYGWIEDTSQWQRIGVHHVPATAGNTERVAIRRCLDCDW
jgi:hypothetical protein